MSEQNSVENQLLISQEFDKVLTLLQNLRRKMLGRRVVDKSLLLQAESVSRKIQGGKKCLEQTLDLVEPVLSDVLASLESKRSGSLHRVTLKSGHVKQVARSVQQVRKVRQQYEKALRQNLGTPSPTGPIEIKSMRRQQAPSIRPPFFGALPSFQNAMELGFVINVNDPIKGPELLWRVARLGLKVRAFVSTQSRPLVPELTESLNAIQKEFPEFSASLRFCQKNLGAFSWLDGDAREVLSMDLICQLHDQAPRGFVNRNVLCNTWHNLIGSPATLGDILKSFENNDNLALAVPTDVVGEKKNLIDWHFAAISQALLPLELITSAPVIPGAWATQSMFWARPSLLKLLQADLSHWDLTDSDFLNQALAISVVHSHHDLAPIRPLVAFDSTHFITPEVDAFTVFQQLQKAPETCETVLPEGIKIAVCRAVTGGYETMMPQYRYSDKIDYWLVTDNLDTPVTGPYAKKLCPYHCQDPRMIARYIKTHLHQIFEDYDYVVWMDGRIVFTGEIEAYIAKTMELGYDVGLIDHPRRSNYHEELVVNRRLKNAEDTQFDLQENEYAQDPDLMHLPLMETNFMVVNLRSPKIRSFYTTWWRHLAKYTPRDQISLCCALRDSQVSFGHILPESTNVRSAPEFALPQHVLCESLLPTLLASYQR